jgi:cell fate regulator YaaT (PSP1 superfamily)
MPLIVGVRFSPAAKVYYFDPAGVEDLRAGEYVIVETSRGQEAGQVVIAPCQVSDKEIVGKLKKVRKRASALELTQIVYHRQKEQDALERCRDKVIDHDLPMKVVRAEYNYDGSRLVFFFASEKRVDFRRLLRDLARSFKARIELRQIGVRDEAKLMGGIGRCGRSLCCTTWLTEFRPVSIKMAKQQDLPLSPMEISGICGRLLCCLSYEDEYYASLKAKLPKRNQIIDTPHGRGKVIAINAIKESVNVALESQMVVEVSHEELTEMAQPPPKPTSSRRRRRRRRSKS